MDGFDRDDLLARLDRLDEDASLMFDEDVRFRMVIVGGSALILLETISRATHDIDALDVSPAIYDLLEKYDINTRVKTFINNFPYNYEDRLVPLNVGGRRIDYFTASLEDIVIAKLYSIRDTDVQDLINENLIASLDWDLLDRLARSEDEAQASALNPFQYRNFLANYEEYVSRWKPHEETDI